MREAYILTGFVSLAVTDIVLRLRFEVVYNLDRAKYHLEHDVLTNLRNRLSFEMRAESYVGRPLFIATGNVDHLALITDFYGNETGDDVFSTFAATLKDLFGEGYTYRYGGNDLLCVATDERAEDASKLLSTCRDRMRDTHFDGVGAPITYSFGFVTGTPDDSDELANMVQMAHIYTHQAQSQGAEFPEEPAAAGEKGDGKAELRKSSRYSRADAVQRIPDGKRAGDGSRGTDG